MSQSVNKHSQIRSGEETPRVAIIGAGMGGLTAAALLAAQGCAVEVFERGARPGGKMREIQVDAGDGRTVGIDGGPTVFTMRWIFEGIFAAAGTSLERELSLEKADVLARHAWNADATLDLYADPARSTEAIGDFAGADEARGFERFCTDIAKIHDTLKPTFLNAQRPSGPLDLSSRVGLWRLGALTGMKPFSTLWGALGGYFNDQRLRQLFGRYSTYCGGSPYLSPATLMLIAHVEQEGVWLIKGGMARLAEALERIARGNGAVFHYGADVRRIDVHNRQARGLRLASGERIPADAVVMNGDPNALAAGLLGEDAMPATPKTPRKERSLSIMGWTTYAETEGLKLSRHTVFFGDDYKREFNTLFRERKRPDDPTVYICAQDRAAGLADPSPNGPERLLIHMNAPATGDTCPLSPEEIAQCEEKVLKRLTRCGLTVKRTTGPMTAHPPQEFAALFPATGGALYGRAPHGWAAPFRRPGSTTRLAGLYLAGGAVHPGAGIPMAAMAGQLASEQILADWASRRRSHPAGIAGGMSTGSARTADTV